MSSWHQFRVTSFDLAPDTELRSLYRDVYKWLKVNASGKYKLVVKNGAMTTQRHAVKVLMKFSAMPQDTLRVYFKKERDASLFKIFFGEFFPSRGTLGRIPARQRVRNVAIQKKLREIVSRNVGRILANEILGVQPMAGPTGQIFTMRQKFRGTMRGSSIKQKFRPNYPGMKSKSPSQEKAARRRLRKKGVFEMPTVYADKPTPMFPSIKTIKRYARQRFANKQTITMKTSYRRG